MKTLPILLILWIFSIYKTYAQCDSLLNTQALLDPFCENEWVDLDLAEFEYRKGGAWTSSIPNIKNGEIKGFVTESAFLVYTFTDRNTNCTATDSIYLKINKTPELKMLKPADVCWNQEDFPLTFNATPYGGEWFDTVNTIDFIENGRFYPKKTVRNDGGTAFRYSMFYTYTDPTTLCADTANTYIAVKPLPIVELNADFVQFAIKDSLLLLDTFVSNLVGRGHWSGPGIILKDDSFYFAPSKVQFDTFYNYSVVYKYTWKIGTSPHCDNQDTLTIKLTNGGITTQNRDLRLEELSISPNPSTGIINIKNQLPFNLKVYNLNGQLVLTENYQKGIVDVELNKGIYWIMVRDVKQIKTQKVVVY